MRLLKAAAMAAALLFAAVPMLHPVAVMAQDAAATVATSVDGTTVVAPDATTVVVPYGNWLDAVLSNAQEIIVAGLLAVVAFVLRKLPAGVADAFRTLRVEQLLARAVDYGINATRGAAKGKSLSVDVGSEVLAKAISYAVDRAPALLIEWLGGVESLKQMILARLNLDPEADADEVLKDR